MINNTYMPSKLSLAIAMVLASPVVMAEQSTDEAQLKDIEVIQVTGRAQQFYLENQTKVGTKIDANIMDIPQSVQVLTEQLMDDQAARDITDLYRSIAGVSSFSYSGVTFRGFRDSDNVFYDGVRGDPFSGFGIPQLFNIERVEVLKGPSGALYGGGEPGGMINYVSKRPSFSEKHEFALTTGSEDRYGVELDSRGELTENIAYRLGGFYEQADSYRVNADEENAEIAGGLLFVLGDATDLYTSFDYVKQDLGGARLRGVPVDDDGNFLVDPSYNANEASDFQKLEALVLKSTLEHEFNDKLTNTTTLRYLQNERDQQYHESRGWVDANGDGTADAEDGVIKREYRQQHRENQEFSLTTDFVLTLDKHQLLFGSDWHEVDTEYDYLRARYEEDGVPNLDIYDPQYGVTDPADYTMTDLNKSGSKSSRYSVYVQDYFSINEQWQLLAGLRYDHFKDTSKSDNFSFSDSNVLPRAGIVYKPNQDTSVYFNYAESFNPQSLSSQDDPEFTGNLEPETGYQMELGVKNMWLNGAFMSTVAVYQIIKQDMSLSNPDDTGPGDGVPENINLGEVESKGVEFTITGDITDSWTMTANYAYNDTVVIEGDPGNTFGDGERFVNAPEHQVGLWSRYALPVIHSSFAVGMDYVSEQVSFDDQIVQAYTIFDASWETEISQSGTLRVNIKNLFDKEYAVSGFNERGGHFPGDPREIFVTYRHQL